MGFISDILFGKKFSYSDGQISEGILRTGKMAALLSSALGEEFIPKSDNILPGHFSKSNIIGVLPDNENLLGNIFGRNIPAAVAVGSLERMGDIIGYKGGTVIKTAYYDKITAVLESKGIPYTVIARRDGLRPLVIKTPDCNIAIAPFIAPQ